MQFYLRCNVRRTNETIKNEKMNIVLKKSNNWILKIAKIKRIFPFDMAVGKFQNKE